MPNWKEALHSYVVKMVLVDQSIRTTEVRAVLLAVVSATAEDAIYSVRNCQMFQDTKMWRVEYVREGSI